MSTVESGLVLLDSAYDLGLLTSSVLHDELDTSAGWPGTARLRITAALASPGAQSVGESRMRYLFWSFGVPKPELQYVVHDHGEVVGIADFAWPEHGLIGEFDGRVKYDRLLRPGETPSDVVFREKRREDRMREITGWPMIRFVWADLADPRRTAERTKIALGWRGRIAR
jgi:hypothetical protein